MRALLSIVCSLALIGLLTADDKSAKSVSFDGQVCCAKCELGKETKCATVVTTKDGDKEVVYYFDSESNKKFPHKDFCKGSTEAKVSGKVIEKDGKKWITVTKIEKK